MDVSRLADLSEIFGTAAIIVSLVYVAVQIRQNTKEMRLKMCHVICKNRFLTLLPVQSLHKFMHKECAISAALRLMSDIDSIIMFGTFSDP